MKKPTDAFVPRLSVRAAFGYLFEGLSGCGVVTSQNCVDVICGVRGASLVSAAREVLGIYKANRWDEDPDLPLVMVASLERLALV